MGCPKPYLPPTPWFLQWGTSRGRHRQGRHEIGIEHWAARGIAARGVLVDVARYMEAHGRALDPTQRFAINPPLLEAVLQAQQVSLHGGDILLIRTGCLRDFEVTCMSTRTQVLITLIALSFIDVVIPLPIVAFILIYVVLRRPTWFTDMVRDIYRA